MALRYDGQALPNCVIWPTATAVLHIMQGFAIVRYILTAHTTHKIFLANAAGCPLPHGMTNLASYSLLRHGKWLHCGKWLNMVDL